MQAPEHRRECTRCPQAHSHRTNCGSDSPGSNAAVKRYLCRRGASRRASGRSGDVIQTRPRVAARHDPSTTAPRLPPRPESPARLIRCRLRPRSPEGAQVATGPDPLGPRSGSPRQPEKPRAYTGVDDRSPTGSTAIDPFGATRIRATATTPSSPALARAATNTRRGGCFPRTNASQCDDAIHSANFDHRRVSTVSLTAIPTARFWPTKTTSFLPLVMPV